MLQWSLTALIPLSIRKLQVFCKDMISLTMNLFFQFVQIIPTVDCTPFPVKYTFLLKTRVFHCFAFQCTLHRQSLVLWASPGTPQNRYNEVFPVQKIEMHNIFDSAFTLMRLKKYNAFTVEIYVYSYMHLCTYIWNVIYIGMFNGKKENIESMFYCWSYISRAF